MHINRGDVVEVDGLLAAVVGVAGEAGVPEDHVALWFGHPQTRRMSEGGSGGLRAEVWIVPTDCCKPASAAEFKH